MRNARRVDKGELLRWTGLAGSCLGAVLLHAGCAGPAATVKPEPAPLTKSAAPAAPTPSKTPGALACTFDQATQTARERALLAEGVALHDRGDYAGAARKYQEILAANPEHIIALSELATTEMYWGHNQEAVAHAGVAVRCRSPFRLHLFITLGSALDNLKNPGAAIAAFRQGLQESAQAEAAGQASPTLPETKELLLYNLAMTLLKAERLDEARQSAEQAALIRPEHASTYLVLAAAHQQLGNRIPAVLALLRFVCLEPTTERSKRAAERALALLDAGVDREKRAITFDASHDDREGNFRAAEMTLGMITLSGGGDVAMRQAQLEALAEFVPKTAGPRSFTLLYNAPFLDAVNQQKLLEPLAQFLMALGGNPEARAWARDNARRIVELVRLAKATKNQPPASAP